MTQPNGPSTVEINNRLDSFDVKPNTLFITKGNDFTPEDGTDHRIPVYSKAKFLSFIYTNIDLLQGSTLFVKTDTLLQYNLPTKEELDAKFGHLDSRDTPEVDFHYPMTDTKIEDEEQKKTEGEKKSEACQRLDELIFNQTLSISKMEANVDEKRREIGLPTIASIEQKH